MHDVLTPLLTLFQWSNVLLMLIGVLVGMVVGILPGIGAVQAMALLIPLTWKIDITRAFVLLVSIYATAKFGGSLTAILFNIPGDAPNAVTLLDGFPLAQKGKAKTAIAVSATVSVLGGLFSAISVIVFMPLMYQMILLFGPPEFFMLAMFGLSTIAAVSGKSIAKGIMTGSFGVLLATVGYHPLIGKARYSLGTMYLQDGINMSVMILGLLAMNEAITLWVEESSIAGKGIPLSGSYREGFTAVFRNMGLFVRSSLIAWVIGVAPGAGSAVAGFVSYASAVKSCKNPENFGKGDVRGLIAADTALHSCSGGDLLPTITIGVPGSAAMAILLGAFYLHGLSPGPQIVKFHLDLVYLIIYIIFFAHLASVLYALALAGSMEKLTKLQAEVISPIVIVLCLVGSYIIKEDWQDMVITTLFGILGYYMKKKDYPTIPLVLGIILGPIAERALFESLTISKNGMWIFVTRIPSLIIFICIVTVIFWPYLERLIRRIKQGTSVAKIAK